MTDGEWKLCPAVSVNPNVVHGTPVFAGTRVPVEDTINSYYGYREAGLSDQETVRVLLKSFPTIPGADALRAVLAYEAKHQTQLQP